MATTIAFCLQKGGVGKSTTAGVTAYLLAKEGFRVLAVDLDSQGNLTGLLTEQNIFDFDGRTIVEALKEQNAMKYVHPVMENLDIIPSNDLTATITKFLYREYGGTIYLCLDETLKQAKQEYDFIVLDTPPALSELTTNALATADEVVVTFQTEQWAYDAIDRFLETFEYAKREVRPSIHLAGIFINVIDWRRKETKQFIKAIEQHYPNKRFDTIVTRRASTSRLPSKGFKKNRELKEAVKPYKPFIKELLQRVRNH